MSCLWTVVMGLFNNSLHVSSQRSEELDHFNHCFCTRRSRTLTAVDNNFMMHARCIVTVNTMPHVLILDVYHPLRGRQMIPNLCHVILIFSIIFLQSRAYNDARFVAAGGHNLPSFHPLWLKPCRQVGRKTEQGVVGFSKN